MGDVIAVWAMMPPTLSLGTRTRSFNEAIPRFESRLGFISGSDSFGDLGIRELDLANLTLHALYKRGSLRAIAENG